MSYNGYIPQSLTQYTPQQSNPYAGYDPNFNYAENRYYTPQELAYRQQVLQGQQGQQLQQPQAQQQQKPVSYVDIFRKAAGDEGKDAVKGALGAGGASQVVNSGGAMAAGETPALSAVMGNGANMSVAPNMTSAITGEAVNGSAIQAAPSYMSWAGPLAVAGIGAYTAKSAWDAAKAAEGKGVGEAVKDSITDGNVLNYVPVLGQARWAGAALGSAFGSGKDKDQMQRDSLRKSLQKNGLMTSDYKMDLGDGSTFDMGIDGKALLDNIGDNIDGKKQRHYYDVDWSDPQAKAIVDAIDPLTANYLQDNKAGSKARSDLTGMLYNRVRTSANPEQALREIVNRFGGNGAGVTLQATQPTQPKPLGMTNQPDLSNFKGVLKDIGQGAVGSISQGMMAPMSKDKMARLKEKPSWIGDFGASAPIQGLPSSVSQGNISQGNLASAISAMKQAAPVAASSDKNAGKKPGDPGYDWNYARAQRKGQARW